VLIQATLSTYGYELTPLQLALWAIPSAIAAFIIHGFRLLRLDKTLIRHPRVSGSPAQEDKLGSRFRGNDEL
jgi:uncharacterized membrane protein